jgi:dTDP-glucose pyrophosphorylase
MKQWRKALVKSDATLRAALAAIDEAGTRLAVVVDAHGKLVGTLSDGDVRRALLKGASLDEIVSGVMYTQPRTARVSEPRDQVVSLMRQHGLHQIPILDDAGVVVGLETVDDFFVPPERSNVVVIMAGGLGTRLQDLTSAVPKPMLKVGDRPLLETIVRNFVEQGFRQVYLAVNYKAEVIENHFGDGAWLGAKIGYLRESKRLGTAGPLSLLPQMPAEPVLVTNGDLLVKVDYADILASHASHRAVATMAVRQYEYQVPYGVIHEQGGRVQDIEEKPIHRCLVSAGMYVLSPEAVALVPRDSFYDMPSLFASLIEARLPTRCYTVMGYWLDIGRLADYEKANSDFPVEFERDQ